MWPVHFTLFRKKAYICTVQKGRNILTKFELFSFDRLGERFKDTRKGSRKRAPDPHTDTTVSGPDLLNVSSITSSAGVKFS